MPSRDPDPASAPSKPFIVLTPATVGVIGVVIIALVVALKYLPAPPAPAVTAAPAYPDLGPRVAELERELAAARSAPPPWPNLADKVAALEATQAELQRLLAVAQAAPEYVILNNRLAALESELEATRLALETARKSEGEARGEHGELADRATRLAKEVAQLRNDRERMQKLLTSTGRQLRQASAERTAPNDRETALAAVVDELHSTRAALATAQDEVERSRDALATLQRSASRSQAEAAADRARLDQLNRAHAALNQENQRLKSALARGDSASPAANPVPASYGVARTHVIAAGDTLSNLSERYYGTSTRWPEIYQANADLLGPTGTLRIGTVLRIP